MRSKRIAQLTPSRTSVPLWFLIEIIFFINCVSPRLWRWTIACEEAESYLINLWKRQSQNGIVNVQLRRRAPQRQPTNPALPYDPFARTLSPADRKPRVQNPFQAASLRLNTCIEAQGEFRSFLRAENSFLKPDTEETRFKPKLRGRAADDPGFQGNVMAFVFDSEEKTKGCGSPTALDLVLLLIGRNREGAEQ